MLEAIIKIRCHSEIGYNEPIFLEAMRATVGASICAANGVGLCKKSNTSFHDYFIVCLVNAVQFFVSSAVLYTRNYSSLSTHFFLNCCMNFLTQLHKFLMF